MTQEKSGPDDDLGADMRRALDRRLGCSAVGDEALLARVKARVLLEIAAEGHAQHRTVRAADGGWREVAPGVERKLLWTSGSAESYMVRLAPGAVACAHLHPMDEECVVLEGSLRIGASLLLQKGDFHVAASGSMHDAVTTDTGALIYIRGAPKEALPG
ncbi:cupin domain-containing protein [Ramlibacter sp. PS3R-8]|uniref:cupin domain-containing protein n=1 Tax=Ramlibacter sp. PS3R-8 TaxID=3133437 RepID=UPI0030A419BA